MADKPKKTGKRRRQRRSLQKPLEHRVVQLHPRSDGGGRPAFTPTAEQRATVENLVTADFQNSDIAAFLNIPQATLERAFRPELHGGKNRVHGEISNVILQGAREGHPTFSVFAAKARLGWRDKGLVAGMVIGPSGQLVETPAQAFILNVIGVD